MEILITGGAGYIGNLLARSLLDEGHRVTIVDNFMFGYESILHIADRPNLSVIKTDIRNADRTYLAGKDVIFHLAAISGYPACEANPNSAQLINVDATRNLVANLGKQQVLVYASTTSLYGAINDDCDEDTKIKPLNLYAATKYTAEKIVMDRANSIALRLATVFGVSPRMRAGLLVNDFVERAVHDRTLVLYTPASRRTFMHIKDGVRAYLMTIEQTDAMLGKVINMGGKGMNFTKQEITEAIRKHIEFDVVVSPSEDEDVRNFRVSFERAEKLGFACEHSLDEGVREMAALYSYYDPGSFIKPI